MAEERTKSVLEFVVESAGAVLGIKELNKSFTEYNQAAELATKAGNLFGDALATLPALIDRGKAVSELNGAFEALQKTVGNIAKNELEALKTATGGVVSEMNLMRLSNEALQGGLKPEQFRAVAEAADALGGAVGVGTVQAMEQLNTALVTGNEKLAKNLVGLIDNKKAEEDFARSKKISVDSLNELGKREAARVAILEAMSQKLKDLGPSSETAGGGLARLRVILGDTVDRFAQAANENDTLTQALNGLADQIQRIDFSGIIQGISALVEAIAPAIGYVNDFSRGLELLAGESTRAKLAGISKELENLTAKKAELESETGPLNRGFDTREGEIAKVETRMASLRKEWTQLLTAEKAATQQNIVAGGTFTDLAGIISTVSTAVVDSNDKYIDHAKLQRDAAAAAKKNAEEQAKLNEVIQKQVLDFEQLNQKLQGDSLERSIDVAIEKLDRATFNGVALRWEEAMRTATRSALEEQNKEAIKAGKISAEQIDAQVAAIVGPQLAAKAEEFSEKLNESFQKSVDFFSDILTPMFEGEAANFEDIFLDAAKRIAIGFASQMAASLAIQFGAGGLANVGSAGGLGQAIAVSLGFGGGGVAGLSGIFGGGAAAGAGAAAFPGLEGLPIVGGLYGGGAAAGGAGGLGALTALLPFLGALGVAGVAGQGAYNVSQGGRLSLAEQAALSVPTFGGSFLYNPVSDFFGGSGRGQREQDARGGFFEQYEGTTFGTVGGQRGFDPNQYNVDSNNPFSGQGVAFTNPLGQIFSGGEDKLGSDIAGVFTNAIGDVENFNELLINTQSLFGALGVDATAAKEELALLFLDGKVSLDEFSTGVQNLNIIAQEDLTGPNSVADAINVVGKALGEGGSPRVALKGLEHAFREMEQAGVTGAANISAYLNENFSPEVASVFEQITATGIDTWEEVKNAGSDQLVLLFNILEQFNADATETFQETGESMGRSFEDGARDSEAALRRLGRTIDDTAAKQKRLNEIAYKRTVPNPNQSNNTSTP